MELGEITLTEGNATLTHYDQASLSPESSITDGVISYFFEVFSKKYYMKDENSEYAFIDPLRAQVLQVGVNKQRDMPYRLKEALKQFQDFNPFHHRKVLIPFVSNHHYLLLVWMTTPKNGKMQMYLLDPFGNDLYLNAAKKLQKDVLCIFGQIPTDKGQKRSQSHLSCRSVMCLINQKQQANDYDCGIYLIAYAEFFARFGWNKNEMVRIINQEFIDNYRSLLKEFVDNKFNGNDCEWASPFPDHIMPKSQSM